MKSPKFVEVDPDEAKLKVLEFILREGPSTIYDITKKFEQMKAANISRVMIRLNEEGSIFLMKAEYTPRTKKFFGPTIFGLLGACADDVRFRKNFESYYNKWIQIPEFRYTAQQLIRDKDMKENPEKAIEVLQKYLDYIQESVEYFHKLTKAGLPVQLQVFFGEMLMGMYKPEETKKKSEVFLKYIIPFKANAEAFLNRAAEMKKESEKKIAALHSTVGSDNELLKEKETEKQKT